MFTNKAILQKTNKPTRSSPFLPFSKNLKLKKKFQAYNDWVIERRLFSTLPGCFARDSTSALTVKSRLHRRACSSQTQLRGRDADECPNRDGQTVFQGQQRVLRSLGSRASVLQLTLLSPYCMSREIGSRNIWKPCNQPQDLRKKCLTDGKHRWSCCVYSFGNKGCHPEIRYTKEKPACFAKRDIKIVNDVTCEFFPL